jgi:hypothetical protein
MCHVKLFSNCRTTDPFLLIEVPLFTDSCFQVLAVLMSGDIRMA